jgi:purine catabolism regulator
MSAWLSDLLDHEPFGLGLVTSNVSTNLIVRGVTATEWTEPGPWFAPGYAVITNGMALRGSAEKQRGFIDDVHSAGVPAVGLWLPAIFRTAPVEMIGQAEAVGMPMFTIPPHIPSREIISFVMRGALTDEDRSLSRAMTAHDYLLGAVDEDDPFGALVTRVHDVLRAPVMVFSPIGEVIAATESPPIQAMWRAVLEDQQVAPIERDWLFTAAAVVGGVPFAYLAIRLHDKPRPATYGGSVARFAARVLQMICLAGQAHAEQARASRAAALSDLLDHPVPDRALLERLNLMGFAPDANVRLVIADMAPSAPTDEILRQLSAAFARRHAVAVFAADQGRAVALVASHDEERAMIEELASGNNPLLSNVGVGLDGPVQSGVQESRREAQLALLRARREGTRVVWFDDIGFADQLLSYVPAERLVAATQLLAPLRVERPDLVETLCEYLARDCNVLATAKALHLHANSLRYRLSVIERVLGRSLNSLETLLELTLALRVESMTAIGDTDIRQSQQA